MNEVQRTSVADRANGEQDHRARRLQATGDLAGLVAHEFNNWLTGIRGYAQLALRKLDESSPAHGYLSKVLRSTAGAASYTNRLAALNGRAWVEPTVVDLGAYLHGMRATLLRLLGEDVELVLDIDPDVGNLRIEPDHLQQVLLNLVINAREAMPSGGRLTIEACNADLGPASADVPESVTAGRHVRLAVSDTGDGIDAEALASIFDPFFTTRGRGKGTGLGLSMAYPIVRQHDGHIWARSGSEGGTTFELLFPRVEDEAGEAEPDGAGPAVSGREDPDSVEGSEGVLVVDGDGAAREAACRALQSRGYAVREAADTEEAAKLFSESPGAISLLLTDSVLPAASGRELHDRLCAEIPSLRAVFMSAPPDRAIVEDAVVRDGLPFIMKPFAPQDLARIVRRALDAP